MATHCILGLLFPVRFLPCRDLLFGLGDLLRRHQLFDLLSAFASALIPAGKGKAEPYI